MIYGALANVNHMSELIPPQAGRTEKGVIEMAEGDLKVVRLHRFDTDSKTKAFVDISIGDYIIKGLRIVNGQKGLFLAMPQEKSKDGKWYNSFYPVTKEARAALSDVVIGAYRE